jgi:PAS domain S-box-containing protein
VDLKTDNRNDRVSKLVESQRRVLERIATSAPLEDVLVTLVELIEDHVADMRCAVLLADATQTRLRFAAAPSLSEDLKSGMEPFLRIAPDSGSCGIASYRREPIYVFDTATDPIWRNGRDVLLRNGVRATWSTPIVADDNRVLGSFAMYYAAPRLPGAEDLEIIDMAVQMARVAIEAKADDELLATTFDDSRRALVVTDMDGYIVRANRAFAQLVGYEALELRGRPVSDVSDSADTRGLRDALLASHEPFAYDHRLRTRAGKLRWARCLVRLRGDKSGAPCYIVHYVRTVSDTEASPVERLSQRERQVLELVIAGRTSKEIARVLNVSPASVDTYRSRIMLKLGVDDLPALVRFAIQHGIASA